MDNFHGDNYNIEMDHGLPCNLAFIFSEDITDWTFAAHVISPDRKTIYQSFTAIPDTDTRIVRFTMSAEKVTSIPSGKQRWELIVTDATGVSHKWLSGDNNVNFRKAN